MNPPLFLSSLLSLLLQMLFAPFYDFPSPIRPVLSVGLHHVNIDKIHVRRPFSLIPVANFWTLSLLKHTIYASRAILPLWWHPNSSLLPHLYFGLYIHHTTVHLILRVKLNAILQKSSPQAVLLAHRLMLSSTAHCISFSFELSCYIPCDIRAIKPPSTVPLGGRQNSTVYRGTR